MAFRKVATLDELWDGEMMALETDGQVVLLVNVHGDVHAYADSCPHLGTRLSQGSLQRPCLPALPMDGSLTRALAKASILKRLVSSPLPSKWKTETSL